MRAPVRQGRVRRLHDQQLLDRMRAGRTDALDELYRRYGERAYQVAMSVCREDRCARGVVHDTFITVWKGRARDQTRPGTVAAWLLSSVYERARRLEADGPPDLLTGLPEDQREVIVLAYYGELSHSEIAASLDARTEAVKGQMRRALRELHTASVESRQETSPGSSQGSG